MGKFKETKSEGQSFRLCSLKLDIIYGIFAAVVPILIPFGQTYQDTTMNVLGHKINVGSVISIAAVVCSLLGTMTNTLMKASKSKEQAALYDEEATQTEQEMSLFLSAAAPYKALASD